MSTQPSAKEYLGTALVGGEICARFSTENSYVHFPKASLERASDQISNMIWRSEASANAITNKVSHDFVLPPTVKLAKQALAVVNRGEITLNSTDAPNRRTSISNHAAATSGSTGSLLQEGIMPRINRNLNIARVVCWAIVTSFCARSTQPAYGSGAAGPGHAPSAPAAAPGPTLSRSRPSPWS